MVEKLLISEAFEIYRIEYIVYRNQSRRTEEMSGNARDALIDFTGNVPIQDLTFDAVRKWKEHLEKTRTANTVRGYIIKLRVVLRHLRDKGVPGILNPNIVGIPKRTEKIVSFLTAGEVNLLIKASFASSPGYSLINRHRNRAIVSLLYASGIRVSELCSLRRGDIQSDGSFTVIGKGNKPRLCFIDERTQRFLESYLQKRHDANPALFTATNSGDIMTPGNIQIMFRNILRKSGIDKPVTPHTMRHSFATNLLRNNTNLAYVKEFLGHTNIQTTAMYTHVVNEDLRRLYAEKHTI